MHAALVRLPRSRGGARRARRRPGRRALLTDARRPGRVRGTEPHAVPGDRRPGAPAPRRAATADVRDRRPHALQAPRARRPRRRDREGLLPRVPARPQRAGRGRLAPGYRVLMDLDLVTTVLSDEPAYRARQVWEWAARGATSYDEMTNLPVALRARLEEQAPFSTLSLAHEAKSVDGT